MTNKEFPTESIENLKAILHKGVSVWIEREKINEERIKFYISVNQNNINTEISISFIIEPEKDKK